MNVPSSAISCAAAANEACATRASEPPTLIRRTPSAGSFRDGDERLVHEQVHRLRRDRGDDRRHLLGRVDERRVEAVRTGLGVRLQPADRLVEVGPPDDEPLGASREDDARAALVDRPARRPDALDGEVERVERLVTMSVESSIERPAIPVAAASATLSATPSGSSA